MNPIENQDAEMSKRNREIKVPVGQLTHGENGMSFLFYLLSFYSVDQGTQMTDPGP